MNAKERIATNPFHVLGLRPDATRVDVERESQRLIAMIEVGLKDAGSYASPTGGMPRPLLLIKLLICKELRLLSPRVPRGVCSLTCLPHAL